MRDNFILTPNVPAMVAPGDEFDVTVGVSNNLQGLKGKAVDITVRLTPPPQLEVVGEAQHSLSLAENVKRLSASAYAPVQHWVMLHWCLMPAMALNPAAGRSVPRYARRCHSERNR